MSSKVIEMNAVADYLREIGMRVDAEVEGEILARLEGFASARAKLAHEKNAALFFAYRVDLDDYNSHGVFKDGKTRKVDALCEGTLDTVYQYALALSDEQPYNYAVFNGNGELKHMLMNSRVALAVHTTVGAIKNVEAELLSEFSEGADQVSGQVHRWNHVAEDIARARQHLRLSKPYLAKDTTAIVVTVQHTGKILWRQFV